MPVRLPFTIERLKRIYRRLRRPFRKTREERFFGGDAWDHGEELSRRRYESYDAYLEHQRHKLSHRLPKLQENRDNAIGKIVRHFRACPQLPPRSRVLCLGARIGSEVEALIRLGHFAVGIDLEPGPENRYVMHGDFHDLVFADDSVDVVYTNCLDHLFDLDRVASEIARVLRPGGVALIDIADGHEEGWTAGGYEATWWSRAETFADRLAQASGLERVGFRSIADYGYPRKNQVALIKRDAGQVPTSATDSRKPTQQP